MTMALLWSVSVLVLLAACQQPVSADPSILAPPEIMLHNGSLYAACKLRPIASLPDAAPKVYGHVLFKQEYPRGKAQVILRLGGFPKDVSPEPHRAVHIHQYGDLSKECNATGGHYNPQGADHPNHPGDFGNFGPRGGKISVLMDSEATLFGGLSVIGRAVVVHEKMDDLGRGGDAASLLHGNSGRRIGCCVIGIHPPDLWDMYRRSTVS